MASLFSPGARVGAFRILEFAGRGENDTLYRASGEEPASRYWLLDTPSGADVNLQGAQNPQQFQSGDHILTAFPVKGTSIAMLCHFVDAFDPAFIGWHWVALAQDIAYLHKNGIAHQRSGSLALESLIFRQDGTLFLLSDPAAPSALVFQAPEVPTTRATPASDVYVLGASLLTLLGEAAPGSAAQLPAHPAAHQKLSDPLKRVLLKAADNDPAKRFPDADAFALALAHALPPPRVAQTESAKQPRRILPLALGAPLLLCLCGLGLAWAGKDTLGNYLYLTALLQQALGQPSGAAGSISPDSLALRVDDVTLTPPCALDIRLHANADGQPLPAGTLLTPAVWTNSRPVEQIQRLDTAFAAPGAQELQVNALTFCDSGGTLRVGARVGNAAASQSIFYSVPITNGAVSNLDGLTFTSVQADTQKYPEVNTYLTVADANGSGTTLKGPFTVQVLQDDKAVNDFTLQQVDPSQLPLTVALVLDVSGSMAGQGIKNARLGAAEFVNSLGPNDTICLYSFAEDVRRVLNCSTDKQSALNAINGIEVEHSTALYDALSTVAADHDKFSGRQAIIVLSDGEDNASHAQLSDAVTKLQGINIPVYAIGLTDPAFEGKALREIAQATGGTFVEAPSPGQLTELYHRIHGQLQNQYVLQFNSIFPGHNEGTIQIVFTDGSHIVSTNRTYVVTAKNQ